MSLDITSYDPDELKRSLIEYVQTKPGFSDINYEGSAFNTVIDLLVRNTHYIAYMANMVATESFLDSAQLRANVVSHAQKLSYMPKSRTASTCVVNIKVIPSTPQQEYLLTCNKGSSFISTVDNQTFVFTTTSDAPVIKGDDGNYYADNVELKQGSLNRRRFLYSQNRIEIPNSNIDTSTIKLYVRPSSLSSDVAEYANANNIMDVDSNSLVYFLHESTTGNFVIEFGKGILGREPEQGEVVDIEFVSVEKVHANGLKKLIAATPIDGYSNIKVDVVTEAYGGAERDTIERMKFLAPRVYETQNRAVRDTDYEAIMIREFPFIKSAKAWGGEKNNPPFYGKIFLCAIPQAGFVIADSVKTIIQSKLSEFSVAGITPEIIDADFIGLRLKVGILFDESQNNETFTQISTRIQNVVSNYNETYLSTFDFWYNNSLLISLIQKELSAVYSIEIDKTSFIQFQTNISGYSKYQFDFINEIRPNSVKLSGIILDANASAQMIVDDGAGNIITRYTKNGIVNSEVIGTVDYQSGAIEFAVLILNKDKLSIEASIEQDNFYTRRNSVVYIDNCSIAHLDDRRI